MVLNYIICRIIRYVNIISKNCIISKICKNCIQKL